MLNYTKLQRLSDSFYRPFHDYFFAVWACNNPPIVSVFSFQMIVSAFAFHVCLPCRYNVLQPTAKPETTGGIVK
jgi:hypothetical protein